MMNHGFGGAKELSAVYEFLDKDNFVGIVRMLEALRTGDAVPDIDVDVVIELPTTLLDSGNPFKIKLTCFCLTGWKLNM